jgi:hypothetical protein
MGPMAIGGFRLPSLCHSRELSCAGRRVDSVTAASGLGDTPLDLEMLGLSDASRARCLTTRDIIRQQ